MILRFIINQTEIHAFKKKGLDKQLVFIECKKKVFFQHSVIKASEKKKMFKYVYS